MVSDACCLLVLVLVLGMAMPRIDVSFLNTKLKRMQTEMKWDICRRPQKIETGSMECHIKHSTQGYAALYVFFPKEDISLFLSIDKRDYIWPSGSPYALEKTKRNCTVIIIKSLSCSGIDKNSPPPLVYPEAVCNERMFYQATSSEQKKLISTRPK